MALLRLHDAFGPLLSHMQMLDGMVQAMSELPRGLSLGDGSQVWLGCC
jgi:hypothetical protein